MHYLYKITNMINNKVYIGQTNNPNIRWTHHKNNAKKGKPFYIYNAIRKYGIDSFHFQPIAMCKTQKQANILEIELIKQYGSHVSLGNGYNMDYGGGGRSGFHFSEASKQQIRLSQWNVILKRIEEGEYVGVSVINKGKHRKSTSKQWIAMIRLPGIKQKKYIGSYATKEEAANAYKEELLKLIGREI